jgi:hypothetical protein
MTRRRLLTAGAGVGAALGASALGLAGGAPAAAHGSLITRDQIGGIPTHYQNLSTGAIGARQSFSYQQNLYTKLEQWLSWYYVNTPIPFRWSPGGQICLNGVHVDKPGMHQYGRAADLSQITMYHQDYGINFDAFNGRYNWWRYNWQMVEYRNRYWGVVAGLNIYFKYVLHYEYNAEHHNHVHVDNEASDGTLSTFSTGSTSQVKMVQAVCNYIYGMGTSIDGDFGDQSEAHSNTVLSWTGMGGRITTSQAHWHRFCLAAMHSGHGLPV